MVSIEKKRKKKGLAQKRGGLIGQEAPGKKGLEFDLHQKAGKQAGK